MAGGTNGERTVLWEVPGKGDLNCLWRRGGEIAGVEVTMGLS